LAGDDILTSLQPVDRIQTTSEKHQNKRFKVTTYL